MKDTKDLVSLYQFWTL